MNGIRQARIRATGKLIQVYLHTETQNWVDASDCKTIYSKVELEIL